MWSERHDGRGESRAAAGGDTVAALLRVSLPRWGWRQIGIIT